MELVVRIQAGERVSDLCREYGISRKTAYKFVDRFASKGPEGLLDQSRARHTQVHRTSAAVVERIVNLKKEHPSWGSKKLKEVLEREVKGVRFPARSTIDAILCRSGLVKPRRMRREVPPTLGPLTTPEAPNHVWAVDYKGQFRLGNGRLCYPLTCSDLSSRFVLGCEALDSTELELAREVFEHIFARFGLPEVIRTDNGAPFASARSLFGLSRLSAFWMSMGIHHERIEPGHPEQNGVHERMHRTLKQETTRPAASNALQQQERFDRFMTVFNEKRPHEGLAMKRPADFYRPSTRAYLPRPLEYALHDDVKTVARHGHVRIGRRNVFLSSALVGHKIGVRELESDVFLLTFASLDLGIVRGRHGSLEPFDRPPQPSNAA
jgi:transposase InsO family protein